MASGVLRSLSDDRNLEKQLEKQMGCMAGFLQMFDRHPGRRICGPKRINSFSTTGSISPSERSDLSAREASEMLLSSQENLPEKIAEFDFKEGMKNSWKLREAPRLSLDSRLRHRDIRTSPGTYSSVADSDKYRRSPSIVARLMGLDALPSAGNGPRLRRSASESRVSRDRHRFVEDPPPKPASANETCKQPPQLKQAASNAVQIRKEGYFDAQDFYPEPSRTGPQALDRKMEKKVRVRGIDEPANDLEGLKQILEALQLKGLLRSGSKPSNVISDRPIVIMKPIRKPVKMSDNSPVGSGPARRSLVEEKRVLNRRNPTSPDLNTRRKPVGNQLNRRVSAARSSSPQSSPRKMSPDPTSNRRLINKVRLRSAAEQGEGETATTNSGSSSLFDGKRSRSGRNLLERCDKLLNSIAEFASEERVAVSDQQPSPVSVLDSPFLGEESSPSSVKKRSIDFKDQSAVLQDEAWVGSPPDYVPESEFPGFAYVSNIITSSDRCWDSPSGVYRSLEKRHGAMDASSEAVQHRRLIFDAVLEILDRRRRVHPWESLVRRRLGLDGEQLIKEVWLEVRRSGGDVAGAEDVAAAAAGAMREDLSRGDHWWGETSDLVLNVERMVFKDLVVEAITDLAGLAGGKRVRNPIPRRALLF